MRKRPLRLRAITRLFIQRPLCGCFFFSSRRRHTRCSRDWSSDVCSSDLLSVDLGHTEEWLGARRALLWIANLSWISVVLLIATLVLMTMQLARANGGHLPQHAPKSLPPEVLGLEIGRAHV